jgi:hypothetical protein
MKSRREQHLLNTASFLNTFWKSMPQSRHERSFAPSPGNEDVVQSLLLEAGNVRFVRTAFLVAHFGEHLAIAVRFFVNLELLVS